MQHLSWRSQRLNYSFPIQPFGNHQYPQLLRVFQKDSMVNGIESHSNEDQPWEWQCSFSPKFNLNLKERIQMVHFIKNSLKLISYHFFSKSSSRKHLSAPKVGEGGMNGHVLWQTTYQINWGEKFSMTLKAQDCLMYDIPGVDHLN